MSFTTVDDPSAHFQVLTYTGNSSSTTSSDRNLTNVGNSDLQPDLIYLFNRDSALTGGQKIYDSTRGAGSGNSLSSTISNPAGYNDAIYGYVNSFNSDGFGVRAGTDSNRWYVDRGGGGGDRYVAYQWKANGGTTSSNTDGTITSTVQANTTGGISIVQWTGGGSAGSVGHGLGQKPAWVIYKKYNNTQNWNVNHEGLNSAAGVYYLNVNFSEGTDAGIVSSAPTATVLNIGADAAASGDNYMAYCFAEKTGFSKFGRAYGNGLARGLYVPCGFKPKFVYWRNTTRNGDGAGWLYDTERDPNNNSAYRRLRTDSNAGESTQTDGGTVMEFRGNGFAVTDSLAQSWNYNDDGYVYAAFAENPFVTSSGAPTTAI